MLAERESQNATLLKPSLLVTDHIFKAMDKKEITATVLIDLSKAFDSICHRTLLLKLQGLCV